MAEDLIGRVFGYLSVEGREKTPSRETLLQCRCQCGSVCSLPETSLTRTHPACCPSCLETMRLARHSGDLTHRTLLRLTLIKDTGTFRSRSPVWQARCQCGNEVTLTLSAIRSGRIGACGACTLRYGLPALQAR
ncbi:MAG: hypothetical protein IJ229_11295 [Clostridia bacterium]|nr:hypothetical protein [Clostridia bacterium]MBR1684654.1 hypothetical protein [Clostridia bacterium]